MKQARGMRNNNPLNIIKSEKINWQGEVKPSTDPNFAQFETLECSAPTTKNMGAGRFGKSWHDGTLRDQR